MCIPSKIIKKIIWCLSFVFLHHSILVGQTVVTTTVTPPYSTDILNYSNNTMVMIQSTLNLDVSLFIDIQGDNGVRIQTKQNYNPLNLSLQGIPFTVSSLDLGTYFDYQNLDVQGVSLISLEQNGLPPGQYQICTRIRNSDGVFITGEAPIGCSNFFTINAVEPPRLIAPFCGDDVTTLNNNVVFSWTTPPGVSIPTISYTLKLIELVDGQDPNQAFLASTIPAFFEKTVRSQTSILYGPIDPPLEVGKRYAWQVIAEDEEMNTPFLNEGRSEVCWFRYKPIRLPTGIVNPIDNTNTLSLPSFEINPQPTPVSNLKGKLLYKFKGVEGISSINSSVSSVSGTNVNVSSTFVDPNPIRMASNPNIGRKNPKPQIPKVGYKVSTNGAKPLAGVSVSLVVTYLFNGTHEGQSGLKNGTFAFEPVSENQKGYMSDENANSQDQVLATTITNQDGSFSFEGFINPYEDYGLVEEDINITTGGGEFRGKMKGDIYKVLRLKVNNQYYLSPDINISINPWESKDIGTLVSLVKSYNLKVKTKWKKSSVNLDVLGGAEAVVSNVNLNIVRSLVPPHVPANEGNKGNFNLGSIYTVIDKSFSTPNGVVFKNLVQHNSYNSKDLYQIIALESELGQANYKRKSQWYRPKNSEGISVGNNFPYLERKIVWNHELKVREYEETIELTPKAPRIKGVVQTTSVNSKPLSNEWVLLFNKKGNSNSNNAIIQAINEGIPFLQKTKTDSKGYYRFDNLSSEYQTLGEIVGPKRDLITNPKGYKGKVKNVGILKRGQQFVSPNADFNLEPDGFVVGIVEDENGNPIKAKVNIENLSVKETIFKLVAETTNKSNAVNKKKSNVNVVAGVPKNMGSLSSMNLTTMDGWKEVFEFEAPSGKRKITVKAVGDNANNYSVYESIIDIPKEKNKKLEKIVLTKKQKRIRLRVLEYPESFIRNIPKPIKNAEVILKDIDGVEKPKLTDDKGYVTFIFENSGADFSFDIKGPKEGTYTSEEYVVGNVQNTIGFKETENVYLKKSALIEGKVTLLGAPLEGAKVFVMIGTQQITAFTDKEGKYNLKNIPQNIGKIEINASKSGVSPAIITETKEISIQLSNTVNFNLNYDNEVSISSIFGFDLEIIKKEREDEQTVKIIEGNILNIQENDNFKIRGNKKTLSFANLVIKKTGKKDAKGIPLYEPVTNVVSLNDKKLNIKLNNSFNAVLTNNDKRLRLIKDKGKGKIEGNVTILKNSFNTSSITFKDEEAIYLTKTIGDSDAKITVFSMEKISKKAFGISNLEGKELLFNLGEFKAVAKKDKSSVIDDKINLYTHLTTQPINGLTPDKLEIELGNLVLKSDELKSVKSKDPIKFKLEKWEFETSSWSFNTKTLRFEILNGKINTGIINVPVSNVFISSKTFDIDNFQLKDLTLGGIIPLNVVGSNSSFGLNKSVGSDKGTHWELRITGKNNSPAANVSLPGFEKDRKINFSVISLLSNGEQQNGIGTNNYSKFYNIINVKPTDISSGEGFVDITSMIDFGIPRVPERAGFIRYIKENGEIKAQLAPTPFTLEIPGKVKLSINNKPENTSIENGYFKAIGRLTDKEGINLQASIQKTNSKTLIEIEEGQSMNLGGGQSSFKEIKGGSKLNNKGDWEKLTFSGELAGFKGVRKGERITFTVDGAINADNENIAVNNIKTPFGNLKINYDIVNARFIGQMNVNQSIGGVNFIGAANMLMGSKGWYFTAGGKATPPGIGEISVGMIIGDSNFLPSDVTSSLMQFAYDREVPSTIKDGVSGLFITGQKDVPIINIPDWDIDLGVVSAKLGAKAGLDARIWMDFNKGGDIYGIGAMAYAHVYFSTSSITCTQFGAEARAELGIKGDYNVSSNTFVLDGCGSITVGGKFEQCFPVPFAGCQGCIGSSISKTVRLDLHLDSNGNTDISFGVGGNCSGLTNKW